MVKQVLLKKKGNVAVEEPSLFESAFRFSKYVTHKSEISFEKMLSSMSVDKLTELFNFLKHDTTKKDLKLLKLASYGIKDLEETQKVVDIAQECIKKANEMVRDAAITECASESGTFDFSMVVSRVEIAKGIAADGKPDSSMD